MKSVWILNHYAQEPGGAGGTRHYSLARSLRDHGWSASIIAASTEHGTGRERLAAEESARLDHFDGVPVLWLKTSGYRGNGADRVRNMVGYTRAALDPAKTSRLSPPEAVVGSSVHPLAAWAGLRLARRHKVPFIFEVRDLWPQTLIDMRRLGERNPLTFVLRRLERHLYRQAARIVVLLPRAVDYITPLGISPEKVVWIPNGVDLDAFPPPSPRVPQQDFTFMYFGAHGAANGLDNVLRAFQQLDQSGSSRPTRLRLIGDGPHKPDLIRLARELQLDNASFENPVPKREIPNIAAEADAFVFNLIDAPVFRYGISSNKLFDFMACARPVIFSAKAPNNPVDLAGGGITVQPDDPAALSVAMQSLSETPSDVLSGMGQANRRHVEENYGFKHLGAQFAAVLDAAVSENRA